MMAKYEENNTNDYTHILIYTHKTQHYIIMDELPTRFSTSPVECLFSFCHWLKCCRANRMPDGFAMTIEEVIQFWVHADNRDDKILRHGQKAK